MCYTYLFRCAFAVLLLLSADDAFPQPVTPLPNAHAHNDYEHTRPLLDALDQGFTSVEADIHLMGRTLIVAHNRPLNKKRARSLEQLYLKPLRERIKANGGQVYPGYNGPFYLMIDIKTDAGKTWQALRLLLEKYREILSMEVDGQWKPGPVTVFLSGNRPFQAMQAETRRLAALDGRPGDLGKDYPATLMPVVSDSFKNVLSWDGNGKIPPAEWEKLTQLVRQAHGEGKKVRLWASPDTRAVWEVLRKAGVDLINADDLTGLRRFLLDENP